MCATVSQLSLKALFLLKKKDQFELKTYFEGELSFSSSDLFSEFAKLILGCTITKKQPHFKNSNYPYKVFVQKLQINESMGQHVPLTGNSQCLNAECQVVCSVDSDPLRIDMQSRLPK